jgi:predicted MPP superfamily phosphohydrolase
VIYNGDLADSDLALEETIFNVFKKVTAKQYYTTGNHEFYIDTDKVLALAQKAGLQVLRSEMVEFSGLQLIGLEYMNGDRESSNAHRVNDLYLNEELPKIKRDPAKPTVLAHHSPVGVQYVAQEGIDVMLSGHTHGGQIFPGTLLIALRFPYIKGRFLVGPTTLLVSQGAGTFGPLMRLGSFNEIQVVRLVP